MKHARFLGIFGVFAFAHAACGTHEQAAVPQRPEDVTVETGASLRDAGLREAHDASDAAAPGREAANYNVILLSVDSLRGDVFFPRSDTPWVPAQLDVMPRLRALLERSVAYTRAYALSSYTSMSVGAFLAGKYPGEIKRSGFFFGSYPSEVVMFPERLQAEGVRTLGAQAHFYFAPRGAGLDQGFSVWEMVPGVRKNNTTDEAITGEAHARLAERLLGAPENNTARFFAWFHFMDPHDVYHPHEGIEYGRTQRERYLGELTWTDRQLGKLLDFIERQPWASRTVIIVTADHGECFGEHGHTRHGFELWQELVHVPWFFYLPGGSGRRIEVPRSHLDLAPTVLDLLGVKGTDGLEGQSLRAELVGSAEPTARDLWIDLPRTSDSDRRRALLHENLKLIAYGDDSRFEVYDLGQDPREEHPLARTDRARHDAMVQRYRAGTAAFHDVPVTRARSLRGAPPGRAW